VTTAVRSATRISPRRLRLLKILSWLPAALVALAQARAALSRPTADRLADLHVYRGSVEGLLQHGSLYDFITSNDAPFTYPPFAGLAFFPLAFLGEPALRVVWTALTLAALVALAVTVASALRDRTAERWRPWVAPIVATAIAASAPASSNIRFGQVSIFLVLIVVLDVLIVGRRYQGILIGLAAAVKLTPLIFIPMLWLGGRRRAAAIAGFTFAGSIALTWAVLPHDSTRFWGTEILNVNRIGHIATGGNQSINGVLLRLDLSEHYRTAGMVGFGLIVGALALWRARTALRTGDALSAVTIVGAASVAISPVSWTHHQLWLLLAALLPLRGPRWVPVAWLAAVLVIMIAPVTSVGAHAPGPLGGVLGETRLLLALLIACVVPLRHPPDTTDADPQGRTDPAGQQLRAVSDRA
jgi:alpha-1,2-mannosyltransferase